MEQAKGVKTALKVGTMRAVGVEVVLMSQETEWIAGRPGRKGHVREDIEGPSWTAAWNMAPQVQSARLNDRESGFQTTVGKGGCGIMSFAFGPVTAILASGCAGRVIWSMLTQSEVLRVLM